ncbi:hypothetical protein [Anaerotruncus colihominis]|uniref:hypothetical protein n=1 Tax=Anaerotruncus colihominis TaxID=169435 RepID=UPI0013A607F2|nr:hypothetical protein [Anaerotruncus colihominis]
MDCKEIGPWCGRIHRSLTFSHKADQGLFVNRGIAEFFIDSRRIEGKKRRNPFGLRGFLTRHSPLVAEKDGIFDFSNSPLSALRKILS